MHLSVLGAVVDGGAAVDVVIAQLGTHYHVLHLDVIAVTTGTARGDDAVGVELIDHTLGTESGVHLADATLLDEHVFAVEERLELAQLLVHCHNYTYFHVFLMFLPAKVINN